MKFHLYLGSGGLVFILPCTTLNQYGTLYVLMINKDLSSVHNTCKLPCTQVSLESIVESLTLAEKQAQFNEFFLISHAIKVNMRQLDEHFALPDNEQLEDHMPYAFRIASEMASIESQALRPLRNLSDHASELVNYLNHQSRKIDLMMSYILHQQDDPDYRFESIRFGGGGVIIQHPTPLDVGTQAELKLFVSEEAAAIFCYGEVITCQQESDGYHIAFIFTRIREQDQELLVRASLHLQTQQLRKRSQNKNA